MIGVKMIKSLKKLEKNLGFKLKKNTYVVGVVLYNL